MKILYAVQGTGNGHITRALSIVPELRKRADTDVLLSGFSHELKLPFKVKHRLKGLSFCFGKGGGIDYFETYRKNQIRTFLRDIKKLDLSSYDLVISDFEPVSCWASIRQKKLCIGLSNQASIFSQNVPLPKSADLIGKLVLRHYAPTTFSVGIHYQPYNDHIFTPVLPEEIRRLENVDGSSYLVYLPAYSLKKVRKVLGELKKEHFIVFSREVTKFTLKKNLSIYPLNRHLFIRHLAHSKGVITAAGFSATSEALFLKKKLLVIPQKGQFEQLCNASALREMGVTVIGKLRKRNISKISEWMQNAKAVKVDFPDNVKQIIDRVMEIAVTYSRHNSDHSSRLDLGSISSSLIA
jgi:uncharacterized protein (TIGR00661 family)